MRKCAAAGDNGMEEGETKKGKRLNILPERERKKEIGKSKSWRREKRKYKG